MSGFDLFGATIACVDIATKTLFEIRTRYESYKKCPSLLKELRKRAKRIRETLVKLEADCEGSKISQEVLQRLANEFKTLNSELRKVASRLLEKSRVEKWLSSAKPIAAFEVIAAHLKSLEQQLDQWRMLFEIKEAFVSEIHKLDTLIRRMMVDSEEWREDRGRFIRMLSSALAALPTGKYSQHLNDEWGCKIRIYDEPEFGGQLCHQQVFACLTNNVPKLLHALSDDGEKYEDNREVLNQLQRFWDGWTGNEVEIDTARAREPADIEIDITGESGSLSDSSSQSDTEDFSKQKAERYGESVPSPVVHIPNPYNGGKQQDSVDLPSSDSTPGVVLQKDSQNHSSPVSVLSKSRLSRVGTPDTRPQKERRKVRFADDQQDCLQNRPNNMSFTEVLGEESFEKYCPTNRHNNFRCSGDPEEEPNASFRHSAKNPGDGRDENNSSRNRQCNVIFARYSETDEGKRSLNKSPQSNFGLMRDPEAEQNTTFYARNLINRVNFANSGERECVYIRQPWDRHVKFADPPEQERNRTRSSWSSSRRRKSYV